MSEKMQIFIKKTPLGDFEIKLKSDDSDTDALLHCRNLIKQIIPACFRRYDRALRSWVVHPLADAELRHFLCFAAAFVPAEVRRIGRAA
jgi:hypothetical protein